MKSYTTLRNLYGSLSGSTSATNLALGDQLINDGQRLALKAAPHLREKTVTLSTTAATAYIALPYDYEQTLEGVKITIGTINYPLKAAPSRSAWNRITATTNVANDYAEWFFIEASTKRIYLYPTPSTSRTGVLTLPYKRRVRDLSVADYTTGTVTATNASTTVSGSGTTWTAKMAGRFIRLTDGDATTSGDGEWYEISSVTNTTTIVLAQAYNGTTAAGSNYTIGQMPFLPDDFHELPVWYALGEYWDGQDGEDAAAKATKYQEKFEGGVADLVDEYGSRTSSVVLSDGDKRKSINPNLFISL